MACDDKNRRQTTAQGYSMIKAVIFDLFGTLTKEYKLALLSNLPYGIYDLSKKHGFKEYFDSIVYSYEEGMVKPNPKMFELSLSRLGLKKDEVIMVGDNFKADVQGSEDVGIKGILLDRNNKHPDYKNRIRKLSEVTNFI